MSKFTLILSQLGVAPRRFEPTGQELQGSSPTFDTIEDLGDADESVATSWLGTPIIDQVVLGNDELEVILDNAIVSLSMTKDIVKTKVSGRAGTVKEWVSDGDFEITIAGALHSPNAKYPLEQVNALRDVLSANTALSAQSKLFDIFGIYRIVVESYTIPQSEGMVNMQPFEINCVSDFPIEMLIDV